MGYETQKDVKGDIKFIDARTIYFRTHFLLHQRNIAKLRDDLYLWYKTDRAVTIELAPLLSTKEDYDQIMDILDYVNKIMNETKRKAKGRIPWILEDADYMISCAMDKAGLLVPRGIEPGEAVLDFRGT